MLCLLRQYPDNTRPCHPHHAVVSAIIQQHNSTHPLRNNKFFYPFLERLRRSYAQHRNGVFLAIMPIGRSGRSFFHILCYMRLKKKQSKLIKEYNGHPLFCFQPLMRVQCNPRQTLILRRFSTYFQAKGDEGHGSIASPTLCIS